MLVSKIEPSLLDAVTRLARMLENPKNIPVLAPLIKKEIIYRVLQGEHGGMLKQKAIEGSSTNQISDVIEHIMNNYEKSFKIEELAEKANMSVSSLHRHFKEVTAMSPIQFQNNLDFKKPGACCYRNQLMLLMLHSGLAKKVHHNSVVNIRAGLVYHLKKI